MNQAQILFRGLERGLGLRGLERGVAVKKLVNLVFFQVVWFAAVIGASFGSVWPGLLCLAAFLAIHYRISDTPLHDFRVAGAAVGVGLVAETVFVQAGLLEYSASGPLSGVAPVWILVLWANFALTMNGCINWLQDRLALSSLLGALGAPISYFGGVKLGAAETGEPLPVVLAAVAVVYAVATPALLRLARQNNPT